MLLIIRKKKNTTIYNDLIVVFSLKTKLLLLKKEKYYNHLGTFRSFLNNTQSIYLSKKLDKRINLHLKDKEGLNKKNTCYYYYFLYSRLSFCFRTPK